MKISEVIERSIDPVRLAQRTGRRYSKDDEYGYDKSDTVKGKYIPLKNYDDDLVDDLEAAQFEIYKSMGFDGKNDLKPIRQKFESKYSKSQDVPINRLVATQPFVRIEDLETLKSKIDSSKQIRVTKYLNKLFVSDGHHAVLAARLRGEKSIPALVIDLDTAKKELEGTRL